MERTVKPMTECCKHESSRSGRLGAGLLLLGGALAFGGCYVVPTSQHAYVAPAPVYVAPAPVYVAPAPVYVWPRYGRRGHGRW